MVMIDHVGCVYRSTEEAHHVLGHCLGLRLLRSFTLSPEGSRDLFGRDDALEVLVFGTDRRVVEALLVADHAPTRTVSHVALQVAQLEETLHRCEEGGLEVRSTWVGDHWVFFVADCAGNLFELKGGRPNQDPAAEGGRV